MALIERCRGQSVASALTQRATSDPERVFILYDKRRLSFGEVESQADALAAGLHNLGLEVGDRLALLLPSGPEFVISAMAASKLGAVVVPLDPRLTVPELHYMLRHSEAAAAVTVETYGDTEYLEVFEELMPQLPEMQYLVTVGEEDLWYDDRIFQWEDLLSAGRGRDWPTPEIAPARDPFALFYTSGTTGKPKAVSLSHASLLHAAAGAADVLGLSPEDRVAGVSDLHHVFGMGPGVLGCLLSGASLVLADPLDGARLLDLVEAHRVTVQYGVPTLFVGAIAEQDERPRDLSSLRLSLVAGAPTPPELAREIEARLGAIALVGYSLTETASVLSLPRPTDSPTRRHFTVGYPLTDMEVRILEGDHALPEESVGEVAVRGPGVMLGYYRQPRETSAAFQGEGFFLTGDLGMLDGDGTLHLVGRKKDVIIRAGFNVYPREVEDRILAHPAVLEVAVVGVRDPVLGETICACVVPVEGAIVSEGEIRAWCRSTLSERKVPDLVRFFDEFPRTGDGKIRRTELVRSLPDPPGA
ncbi:MAG: class I adenylate-forming enzyme family protein [Longimicrobiales bacterium]|nr:class I adenylate-forming enzyme family protein [Longimicrobiales bacterium]